MTDDDPANIVGVDWNGPHKIAYKGKCWTSDRWRPADHLRIRESVRKSLEHVKQYWQDHGLWPELEPRDISGPAVQEPDKPVFARSGEAITSHDDLETAYTGEYDNTTYAFKTETAKKWFEHREIVHR